MEQPDRRTVLLGAGALGAAVAAVPLLSACGGGSGGTANGTSAAPVTVSTDSVPLHGGVISDKVVVTQPADGEFRAFSAVCPHQGCTVDAVVNDVISCPCHGSTFSATDGARLGGPATRGLTEFTATVSGSEVTVAD